MRAKRAIAHTRYNKTLESERLHCRLATIPEMRSHNARVNDLDHFEPLTYEQAISGPFARKQKKAIENQMKSFAPGPMYECTRRMLDSLEPQDSSPGCTDIEYVQAWDSTAYLRIHADQSSTGLDQRRTLFPPRPARAAVRD